MAVTKVVLISFIFFNEEKLRRIQLIFDIEKWLKVRILLFSTLTKNGPFRNSLALLINSATCRKITLGTLILLYQKVTQSKCCFIWYILDIMYTYRKMQVYQQMSSWCPYYICCTCSNPFEPLQHQHLFSWFPDIFQPFSLDNSKLQLHWLIPSSKAWNTHKWGGHNEISKAMS